MTRLREHEGRRLCCLTSKIPNDPMLEGMVPQMIANRLRLTPTLQTSAPHAELPPESDRAMSASECYRRLVEDCKAIRVKESVGFLSVLEAKYAIGKRIGRDINRLKVGRPRKNSNSVTLGQLAKDLGYSTSELKKCIRFAQKYSDFGEFVAKNSVPGGTVFLTWKRVREALWGEEEKALGERRQLPDSIEVPEDSDRERLSCLLFWKNVWPLSDRRPKGYGSKDFRGNTSPEILTQCLARYTNPGDLVLDPMAGSGTTIDICKAMGRRIVASDIKAWREDFQAVTDAENIEICEQVDFIFAHLPYLDVYKYSDQACDLSNLNLNAFVDKLDRIFARFRELLKPDRFAAVLIGDVRKSGLIDLSGIVSQVGSKHLQLWDKAVIAVANPASHSGAHGNIGLLMERAKRFNFMVQTFDTLLVFRKNKKEE